MHGKVRRKVRNKIIQHNRILGNLKYRYKVSQNMCHACHTAVKGNDKLKNELKPLKFSKHLVFCC